MKMPTHPITPTGRAPKPGRLPKPGQPPGLGDAIKRVTTAVGIKPCEGCEKRAEKLNRLFPLRREGQRSGG